LSDDVDEKVIALVSNLNDDSREGEKEIRSKVGTSNDNSDINLLNNEKRQDSTGSNKEDQIIESAKRPSIGSEIKEAQSEIEQGQASLPANKPIPNNDEDENQKDTESVDIEQQMIIAAKAALKEKYSELIRVAEHRKSAAAWRHDQFHRHSEDTKTSLAALLSSEGVNVFNHDDSISQHKSDERRNSVEIHTAKTSCPQKDISSGNIGDEEKDDKETLSPSQGAECSKNRPTHGENNTLSPMKTALSSPSLVACSEKSFSGFNELYLDSKNVPMANAIGNASSKQARNSTDIGQQDSNDCNHEVLAPLVSLKNAPGKESSMYGVHEQQPGFFGINETELEMTSDLIMNKEETVMISTNTPSHKEEEEKHMIFRESPVVTCHKNISNAPGKQEIPYPSPSLPKAKEKLNPSTRLSHGNKSSVFPVDHSAGKTMRFWQNQNDVECLGVPPNYKITRHSDVALFYVDNVSNDGPKKEDNNRPKGLAVDFEKKHSLSFGSGLPLSFDDAVTKCLHTRILDQCAIVENFALRYFLERSMLLNHFVLLRHFMLGLGSYMQHFASSLLSLMILERERQKRHLTKNDASIWCSVVDGCHQLSTSLSALCGLVRDSDISFSYHVDLSDSHRDGVDLNPFHENALTFFRVFYDVASPLSLFLDEAVIAKYTKLHAFILRHIYVENVMNRLWLVLSRDDWKNLQSTQNEILRYHLFRHKLQSVTAALSQYIRNKLGIAWEKFFAILCGKEGYQKMGLRGLHDLYSFQHDDLDWLLLAFFQFPRTTSSRVRSYLDEYYSIVFSIAGELLSSRTNLTNQYKKEIHRNGSICIDDQGILHYEERLAAFMDGFKCCLRAASSDGTSTNEHFRDLLQLMFFSEVG